MQENSTVFVFTIDNKINIFVVFELITFSTQHFRTINLHIGNLILRNLKYRLAHNMQKCIKYPK